MEKELEIIRRKVPELSDKLAHSITKVMQSLRNMDLQKKPGIAETIDWSMALLHLGTSTLSGENILDTAGTILKHRDDITLISNLNLDSLLSDEG